MTLCPLCRASVAPGTGTLLKAGRKPLAVVHENCASVAQQGVALFGKLALLAGGQILESRAPHALAALKSVHKLMQQRKLRAARF